MSAVPPLSAVSVKVTPIEPLPLTKAEIVGALGADTGRPDSRLELPLPAILRART